jgi:hypothetical protein
MPPRGGTAVISDSRRKVTQAPTRRSDRAPYPAHGGELGDITACERSAILVANRYDDGAAWVHDGGVDGRRDLPGYSGTQETEALGLFEVQRYLVSNGFKVTEVSGRFDDGLDLLVSPHDETNVFPAIAGIQVRSGPSHQGLTVGRHECYWRELNMPVFGVVLADPRSSPPRGHWCDAQSYLRDHVDVPTIPTPNRYPDGLAQAIDLANAVRPKLRSSIDRYTTQIEPYRRICAGLLGSNLIRRRSPERGRLHNYS